MAHAYLLLACPDCRQAVAVGYDDALHAQGQVDLDEHRTCHRCGKPMVETERDEQARIICPDPEPPQTAAKPAAKKS